MTDRTPFPLKWRTETDLYLSGCVTGRIDGDMRLFVQGADRTKERAAMLALNGRGELLWEQRHAEEPGAYHVAVTPTLVDLTGRGDLGLAYFVAHRGDGSDGEFRVISVDDGRLIWKVSTGSFYGGNRDVAALDIDGDGEQELIVGFNDHVRCLRARDGRSKWRYDDRVKICWGHSALVDLEGTGEYSVVLGGEYCNPDGSSSFEVLDSRGRVRWRRDGIPGDCGSTAAIAADVDGDGRAELLKCEIDLCGGTHLRRSRLWCFRPDGEVLWKSEIGAKEIAVGDWDYDGRLEAATVTDMRDGGYEVAPELLCIDLTSGEPRWRVPIERGWLSNWPVLAHLDADDELEAVLGTMNPSGYGKLPDQDPYGDLYVVKADGSIMARMTFRDQVLCQIPCDVDHDGLNELIVPCGDGAIYAYDTQGRADDEWPLSGRTPARWSSQTSP
jgi:outer membrane protein assembly factor BamB